MYDVGNELTIYTSSRSLLGNEFRQQLSGEFAKLYADMEAGLSALAFLAPNLPTPAFRKRDKARARMVELITGIVADRRERGHRRRGHAPEPDGRDLQGRPQAQPTTRSPACS